MENDLVYKSVACSLAFRNALGMRAEVHFVDWSDPLGPHHIPTGPL